jgi:prevent-host-death family protein
MGVVGVDAGIVAILLAMSTAEHLPLAEVKNRLSEVVERLEREHGRVVITKHGRPAAVVVNVADLESLEETVDVLADQALVARIQKAMAELAAGKGTALTKDQALALLSKR